MLDGIPLAMKDQAVVVNKIRKITERILALLKFHQYGIFKDMIEGQYKLYCKIVVAHCDLHYSHIPCFMNGHKQSLMIYTL